MSGVPKSSALLILTAFSKDAVGVETPTSSLRYWRIREIVPPVTAVACDEPDSDIYNGSPLLAWVPVPHVNPIGDNASSALPEQMFTPGATKSGLTLASRAGPNAEKLLTSPEGEVVEAPTESTFIIGSNSIHSQGTLYSLENTRKQKNSIKTFFKKYIDFFN